MSRCPGRVIVVLSLLIASPPALVFAAQPANDAFNRTWERTERPVTDRATARTWTWGPEARTGPISEPYLEAPDGYREVQYYDKTRMEINNPAADPNSPWYVTNGLLAKEMITGRIQVGHLTSVEVEPAEIPVAGDQHPDTPSYQTLAALLDEPAVAPGTILDTRLSTGAGEPELSEDPELASHGVEAGYYVPETDHTVAEPFWSFLTSSGLIRQDGVNVHGPLFPDPFFVAGLPITGSYWVNVPVDGDWRDVLLQCFERRCLTYTPENPEGWQVEAGNIGLHYHRFRYGRAPEVLDCVDLNLAMLPELIRIASIGDVRARAVMAQRPFGSVDDLERVHGIGPVTVERIVEQGLACVEYDSINEEIYRPD